MGLFQRRAAFSLLFLLICFELGKGQDGYSDELWQTQDISDVPLTRVKRPMPMEDGKRPAMGDFGHKRENPHYALRKRPPENFELMNPPLNVWMPSSTAQQVLVRQAILKGRALGRTPDFGTNAKQFLAMGEAANAFIDSLRKLPECVVGNCGGSKIQVFAGNHPEKEILDYVPEGEQLKFEEAGDEQPRDQSEDDLATQLVQGVDLHFNDPAFENINTMEAQKDSAEIEPSFYWNSVPTGLDARPILPPADPPAGSFELPDEDKECKDCGAGLVQRLVKLDWNKILGILLYMIMAAVIFYGLVRLACCLTKNIDFTDCGGSISKWFSACDIADEVSKANEGEFCSTGIDVCKYFAPPPPGGLGHCVTNFDIDICDLMNSDYCEVASRGGGKGGSGGAEGPAQEGGGGPDDEEDYDDDADGAFRGRGRRVTIVTGSDVVGDLGRRYGADHAAQGFVPYPPNRQLLAQQQNVQLIQQQQRQQQQWQGQQGQVLQRAASRGPVLGPQGYTQLVAGQQYPQQANVQQSLQQVLSHAPARQGFGLTQHGHAGYQQQFLPTRPSPGQPPSFAGPQPPPQLYEQSSQGPSSSSQISQNYIAQPQSSGSQIPSRAYGQSSQNMSTTYVPPHGQIYSQPSTGQFQQRVVGQGQQQQQQPPTGQPQTQQGQFWRR